MKIRSSIAIAAAAGSAVAPNALAADMSVKARPQVAAAAWNWTGFYVGAHLGAAWQEGRAAGTYADFPSARYPFNNKTSPTGFVGGGQIGYNWQSGIFVYGLEADISGLSGSGTASQVVAPGAIVMTSTNVINWLGTIRGRAGVTIGGDTLVYATGGFAYGRVTNTHTEFDSGAPNTATWQEQGNRSGYAVGGGIEHMFGAHWTVRLEGLYVDLGKKTLGAQTTGVCDFICLPVTFQNEAIIARGAINYQF
jgi:outer membrane immunogenic protein